MTMKNIVRLARTRGGPRRRRPSRLRPVGAGGGEELLPRTARRAPSPSPPRAATALRATPRSSSSTRRSPRASSSPAPRSAGATTNYFFDAKGTKLGLDDQFARRLAGKKGGLPARPDLGPEPQLEVQHRAHALHRDRRRASSTCPDGMRLALQNVYVPWVTPTAAQPGRAPARLRPTRPSRASSRWSPGSTRACPRSTCATCARPAGPASASRWARTSSSTRATRTRRATATRTRPSTAAPTTRSRPRSTSRPTTSGSAASSPRAASSPNATADFSKFTNDVPFAEIDNPERLQLTNPTNRRATVFNDAASFRLWLPPDNKAYQPWTSPAASRCRRGTRSRPRCPPAT